MLHRSDSGMGRPAGLTNSPAVERSSAVRDRKWCWYAAFLVALSICTPRMVCAQAQTTSSLTGTITDSTGAVVPGATVSVTSPSLIGGAHTSVTDNQRVYRFPSLQPGVYELTAELAGFRKVTRTDVKLPLGATITVDVAMGDVTATEAIVVSGST